MFNKMGFGFSPVYVLVFAIVSTSVAIVILLSYSIVSDTPIRDLVPEAVERFIIPSSNGEKESGGILGNLFGNKKSTGGGSSSGGTTGTGGTAGNPPNNTNQTLPGNNTNQTIPNPHPNFTSVYAEYITPGNGWNNQLTLTPSANGTGPTPIARWDFVPYQTINNGQEIGIGVVAFHIYGIEKVLFAVEGGEWIEVREMSYNPYSRVWEYWIKMRANDFNSDGLKEVRAIVYPKIGQPRVLQGANLKADSNGIHSMFINTNKQSSLQTHIRYVDSVNGNDVSGDGTENNPFKSIGKAITNVSVSYGSADGAVAYLKAGNYTWNGAVGGTIVTNSRWATIMPAPGVRREHVLITDSAVGGMKTRLIRAHNITQTSYGGLKDTGTVDAYFWFDYSVVSGNDLFSGDSVARGNRWAGVIVTESEAYNSIQPFRSADFIRNSIGENYSDTPIGRGLALNVRMNKYVRNPSGTHADGFHWYFNNNGTYENYIIYGLEIVDSPTLPGFRVNPISQGGQRLNNVALVNVHISRDQEISAVGGADWGIDSDHLLFYNVQVPDQRIMFDYHTEDDDGYLTLTNVAFRNSIFWRIGGFNSNLGSIPANSTVEHVHVLSSGGIGDYLIGELDLTEGEINGGSSVFDLFVSPTALNYKPKPGSVIYSRVPNEDLIVPADIHGLQVMRFPASLGSFAG